MKITLFVGTLFSPVTTFLFRKVKALAERGEYVTVITSGMFKNKFHEEFMEGDEHIKIVSIPVDDGTFFQRLSAWLFLLVRALLKSPKDTYRFWLIACQYRTWRLRLKSVRKLLGFAGLRSDIYHFEYGDVAVQYIDYLKSFAKPCVVSFRGSDIAVYPLTNVELKSLYQEVIQCADRIHCTSDAIVHQVARLGGSTKTFVNHPAIKASYFEPDGCLQRDPNLVLTVGRLKWVKGLTFSLLAVSQLLSDFPNLRYVIVGDGPSKNELAFYVENLGIQKNVEFYGRALDDQVKNLLAKTSVFILPSVSEGLSNAVLEAMAMEVPIVTTDAGGMAEAVTDGVEGFVVPRYNPSAIAARTRQLLRDEDLRRKMGQNGRQRVLRDFTIERQVQVFLDEYSALKKKYESKEN